MTSLKHQAIQTALTGDWTLAISLNQSLLEENPNDVDALNRIAFAYSTIGKIKEAKRHYLKVLTVDKNNPIALRNLKRLGEIKQPLLFKKTSFTPKILNNIFLEETGKTKVIELVNTADKKTVSSLNIGESLVLCIKRSKIFVQTEDKQYIGMLPEDVGRRIIKFLKGGNEYESYVKSIKDHNKLSIFIKEIKRVKRFKNQPSFLLLETVVKKKGYEKVRKEMEDMEDSYSEESEEE